MKIDYGLILCAGFGTRMGPIGNILPKPLWPIFEKPLLELQIRFVKDLGCERIFVNTHHQHHLIKDFIDDFNKRNDFLVETIHEPEILGTGGAIHNLAALDDINYKGSFLYLASDQFYFFSKSYIELALKKLKENSCVLFGIEIDKDMPYSHLVLDGDLLKEIKKPDGLDGVTFSGLALLNLEKIKKSKGHSGFFETVCRYQEDPVLVLIPDNGEYVDWGSAPKYFQGMFDLLQGLPSNFAKFCQHWEVFNPQKWHKDQNSYGLNPHHNLINLTTSEASASKAWAILLGKGLKTLEIEKSGLYFENIVHELPS